MKRFSIILSVLAFIAGLVALYFSIAEILKRRGYCDDDCDCNCDCDCDCCDDDDCDEISDDSCEEEMDFLPDSEITEEKDEK